MTHQQALDKLIEIRNQLGIIIDKGMEQRFVDMQLTLPREIEFDLISLETAWEAILAHATEQPNGTIFIQEN